MDRQPKRRSPAHAPVHTPTARPAEPVQTVTVKTGTKGPPAPSPPSQAVTAAADGELATLGRLIGSITKPAPTVEAAFRSWVMTFVRKDSTPEQRAEAHQAMMAVFPPRGGVEVLFIDAMSALNLTSTECLHQGMTCEVPETVSALYKEGIRLSRKMIDMVEALNRYQRREG